MHSNSDPGNLIGGPVAKTPHSQYGGSAFDPWSGNWSPHAMDSCQHMAKSIQYFKVKKIKFKLKKSKEVKIIIK